MTCSRDIHPAISHQIINAPNPYTPAFDLPDGTAARVVALSAPLQQERWRSDFSNWWPLGHTAKIRGKLLRRIVREGYVLPLVVSSCLALLLSISTTTTSGSDSSKRRIRLRYRSNPISDFGVAVGSVRVTAEDKPAYLLPNNTIMRGRDPEDHYWIYFRTLKGEEVTLDCQMFTFNMCMCVQTSPYLSSHTSPSLTSFAPALFKDRTLARNLPADRPLLTKKHRFSVLRDSGLRRAMKHINSPTDDKAFIFSMLPLDQTLGNPI